MEDKVYPKEVKAAFDLVDTVRELNGHIAIHPDDLEEALAGALTGLLVLSDYIRYGGPRQ